MDRGAWWSIVHGVTKSQTRLRRLSQHARIADYPCCDTFRWRAEGLCHSYACVHSPPDSPPIQTVTEHGAELPERYSSACSLPILNTAGWTGNRKFVLEVRESRSALQVHLYLSFLDSTYEDVI